MDDNRGTFSRVPLLITVCHKFIPVTGSMALSLLLVGGRTLENTDLTVSNSHHRPRGSSFQTSENRDVIAVSSFMNVPVKETMQPRRLQSRAQISPIMLGQQAIHHRQMSASSNPQFQASVHFNGSIQRPLERKTSR
jgi:hypothetical protein